MSSGFQNNAFQNNAFQTTAVIIAVAMFVALRTQAILPNTYIRTTVIYDTGA